MLKNTELYDFQADAVGRMLDRQSLLLAHDMGLGKTVTSIAAIEELIDSGAVEQVLVICPASVKWQWKKRIEEFTDGALVKVVTGNKNERWAQYRAVRRGDVEYTIMNYEQVVSDWDTIRHFAWDAIVCDEITYIKSPAAKRTRHVRRLQAPYRFGLTGQPIENRPEELWHIMKWLDPTVLGGNPMAFDKTFVVRNSYGGVKNYKNLNKLRGLMEESMHRKTRHDPDVKSQMPKIVHTEYLIDFDSATKKVYNTIVRELVGTIRGAAAYSSFNLLDHYSGTGDNYMNAEVMPRIMALRMLCDHPALLTYSADLYDDPESQAGSQYASALRSNGAIQGLKRSPKLEATLEVVSELLDASDQNKVVLFSFFKPMLRLIGDRLKVGHEYFTGDTSTQDREKARDRFQSDPGCRVLLSSDAGGIGVDLPAANYLISYDLPWSAGKLKQREARIDRISSEWDEITLIKMCMEGSIEEWMLMQLEQKIAVGDAWIDGKYDRQGNFELTAQGLCDFLETS